ncbi:RHS Repeat family protein [Burkholderia pseudomallei MSHR3458]|nr:RHS Repeat family protein [Burkholderia pseudomallei MSHR2243]KGU61869.1 RHS Repeat family protein [Burkholderia pseudomallei MSHR465J]KGW71647.1 RHS Repeat family protein [Burkholderia pseudomallei MSHR3458]
MRSGKICTEQLGAELRRELSYESGGQLASQRTLLTGTGELFASEYTYDANGELVEKRDSRGGIERFQYDPVGRVIAHLDPAGQLRRYLYDPAGDLLKTHIRERRTADAAAAAKAGTWVREGEYEGCYYAYDRVGTRECLAIEVDTSLPGLRVQQVLARLKEMRGLPASITVDNGPAFAGKVLDCMGLRSRRHAVVHSAWQAGGKCLYRVLQRALPRRMPERALVRLNAPRQAAD